MTLRIEFCDVDDESGAGSIIESYPVSEDDFDRCLQIVQNIYATTKELKDRGHK
jgi:hypothetical protein